jgi:hypothetical protein
MLPLAAVERFNTPPDLRPLARTVFTAIAAARFTTVPSLLAYAGPSGLTVELLDAWSASGLLHRGLVRLDPLSPVDTPYVALTTRGAHELGGTTLGTVTGISGARLKRSSQKRAHDVAVGDLALTLLALARDGRIDLAGLEADDAKFATSVVLAEPGDAPRHVALQADLYAVVRGADGPVGVLWEVDRGTVSVERMALKYRGYLAWRRTGGPERDFGLRALRVVTIAPEARRLDRLLVAAADANDGHRSGFLLFVSQDDVTPRDADRLLEPVARRLGDRTDRIPLFADARARPVRPAA